LSLALLGYAFYQAYRPGAVRCAEGGRDISLSVRRRRTSVWVMTVVVVLLVTTSWWANRVIYWML
jgi:hypothetical protein